MLKLISATLLLATQAMANEELISTLEAGSWGWPEGERTCAGAPGVFGFQKIG